MRDSYVFYKKNLEGSYLETFDKIEIYCITKSMDMNIQEELLMELVDVFLTAQKNGKSVKNIVGNDLGSFCRNFCSGIGFKNQIKGVADVLKRASWIILIFCLIDLIALSEGVSFFEIQSDLMPLIVGVLIGATVSLFLGMLFKALMFRYKKINMNLYLASVVIVTIILVIGCIFITDKLKFNVFDWELILISSVYLLCFYILRKVYFPELKKPQKIRFSDMIIDEVPKAWAKIMEKQNKRHLKNGNEQLTSLEFTKTLQKKHRFDEWICIGGWCTLIALYLGFGIKVALESKLFDTVMFMIILCFIYIPIGFFLRSTTRSMMWQKKTLDICVEQDIDVFSYIENQRNV